MDKKFEYTYSAITEDERGEIENIRSRYIPRENEDGGVAKLRALDKKVKNPPLVLSLTLGVAGTLIFGLGLSFSMEWSNLYAGIPLSLVGAVIMALNPFIHKKFLAARKKKYGEEILNLSSELLGKEEKPKKEIHN